MNNRVLKVVVSAGLSALLLAASTPGQAQSLKQKPHRNVIIFVADGLRAGSVNPTDAPTLYSVRTKGVNFINSHAMFPTFTTPNASAIATGHYLGDTGDFSNTIFSGYPIFNTGNFGQLPGTLTPFVENDRILADLDDHYNGNWLTEESLLQFAREHGYNTASVGKVGPVGLQDVSDLQPVAGAFVPPHTVFVDDATGNGAGIPLRADIAAALVPLSLSAAAPNRSNGCAATDQCNNGFSGNNTTPGTTSPNTVQQQYFADVTTKAILPTFVKAGQPFAILFWSRDPDGTQHNQGDSLNSLTPGINGPTSKAAVHNADNNLKQILDFLASNPEVAANTDVFVTADHGFATISKHEIDAKGHTTKSFAATCSFPDVNPGFLPVGFVALDLAHGLNLPLFDPDSIIVNASSQRVYEQVDCTQTPSTTLRQHPATGDGLIGATGQILNQTDAKVIVAANGGSDLIYIPDHDPQRLQQVVAILSAQDYVGAIFVNDIYGVVPGSLPLSSINLVGNAATPTPDIALGFKTFYLRPFDLQSAVQVADSGLQEGQGMHGSIGRDNTFNNMAAIGPDFKSHFVDFSPVSNADIAPTLAAILGFDIPASGSLQGRVIREALKGGPLFTPFIPRLKVSSPTQAGGRTIMLFQTIGDSDYFDAACFDTAAAGICQ